MTSGSDRIALVTGANKGIGFEISRQLARKGIHVLIGSRDPTRGSEAMNVLLSEDLPVSCVQIDVTNQDSIDAAVSEVTARHGRLDILVNNSGVFEREPRPSELTLDRIRQNFDVNFFGTFAVTKVLPALASPVDVGAYRERVQRPWHVRLESSPDPRLSALRVQRVESRPEHVHIPLSQRSASDEDQSQRVHTRSDSDRTDELPGPSRGSRSAIVRLSRHATRRWTVR